MIAEGRHGSRATTPSPTRCAIRRHSSPFVEEVLRVESGPGSHRPRATTRRSQAHRFPRVRTSSPGTPRPTTRASSRAGQVDVGRENVRKHVAFGKAHHCRRPARPSRRRDRVRGSPRAAPQLDDRRRPGRRCVRAELLAARPAGSGSAGDAVERRHRRVHPRYLRRDADAAPSWSPTISCSSTFRCPNRRSSARNSCAGDREALAAAERVE